MFTLQSPFEQRALAFDASAITGERTIVSADTMAGDCHRHCVRREGPVLATARTDFGAPIRFAMST